MALAWFLTNQFDDGCVIEITSVSFIGIDVDFEFGVWIFADQQVVEGHRALWAFDFQSDEITILHAVESAVAWIDVNVTGGANDSFFKLDSAGGADENAARGSFDIAAMANRSIDAQGDRVGESQFDLACFTRWAKNANVWDHASARSDDHHRFSGSKETVLVKVFLWGQFFSFPEELFNVFIRQVNVSRGDAYNELWRR